jgi:hypothetical protein
MHRVIDVDTTNNELKTQGDNPDTNRVPIKGVEEDITKDQYIGKIVEDESYW